TDLVAAGIPVTVLNKRFKGDPFAWLRLRRLLKKLQPDVLHTWLFAANSYGRLAAGSVPRMPVVVSERCVDSWKAGWQLWLDRRLVGRTTRLVGNSQSVADFYHSLGVPAEKLAVIYNGIDSIEHPPQARETIRRELEIKPESHVVGYVGRMAKQK